MVEDEILYSIGVVERDTGVGRDTLRVWERRYGFPRPARNEKGERMYPESQLRRLQRIRRLLDQGLRPGALLALSETEFDRLDTSLQPEQAREQNDNVRAILDAMQLADAAGIDRLLRVQYEKQGLRRFVVDTVSPLLTRVGQLWAAARLQVYQEHFLSERLIRFLNTEIANMPEREGAPRVVLATLPGEQHTLGLLMVAAVLASDGIPSINLGGEVPMDQIVRALQHFRGDTLGITFSGAYPYRTIRPHLLELRELIADDVAIWVGGEGVRRLRKLPIGVTKFRTLERLPPVR